MRQDCGTHVTCVSWNYQPCVLITTMSKRINIILPDKTVAVLDRVASRGTRSRFIDRAVRHYVETEGMASLREQLKAGYRAWPRALGSRRKKSSWTRVSFCKGNRRPRPWW